MESLYVLLPHLTAVAHGKRRVLDNKKYNIKGDDFITFRKQLQKKIGVALRVKTGSPPPVLLKDSNPNRTICCGSVFWNIR